MANVERRFGAVGFIERIAERLLWSSRLAVLAAVGGSLVVGFGMFFVATVDVVHLAHDIARYPALFAAPGHALTAGEGTSPPARLDVLRPPETALLAVPAHDDERSKTVAHIVEVIDGYLLATIMLIFAFGLYELFISRIDVASKHREMASRLLLINSLDDLKDRLAKVVLLILIVKFFEHALRMSFPNPFDLLELAVGIALVSVAIFLSHRGESHKLDSRNEERLLARSAEADGPAREGWSDGAARSTGAITP